MSEQISRLRKVYQDSSRALVVLRHIIGMMFGDTSGISNGTSNGILVAYQMGHQTRTMQMTYPICFSMFYQHMTNTHTHATTCIQYVSRVDIQ